MNQKEYNIIANVLSVVAFANAENDQAEKLIKIIVKQFADQFEKNYSNFDRDKFLKACGL